MIRSLFALAALCGVIASTSVAGSATSIVDEWSSVRTPTPPPLQAVTVDPSTTALLVLDFVQQLCKEPRCLAGAQMAGKALQAARASHMMVVYSLGGGAKPTDILPAVAPLGGEPIVVAPPDKFLGTDLQQILSSKGIKTVIVTGFAAEGAVLYTASHASLAGFKVIVPVDAMPSSFPYAEQYVVWHLANAPRPIKVNVTLTTTGQLTY